MNYPALEKFINTMGLRVSITTKGAGFSKSNGKKFVCYKIVVSKDDNLEYVQYHCYSKGITEPKYMEGNEAKAIKDGVLAYLGDHDKVDNYFESKTRQLAKEYLFSEK